MDHKSAKWPSALLPAATAALGELPGQLHLLEVDEQRGRGLFQFNLTNRRNNLTRITNFGAGAYPTNPVSNFKPDHVRGRSENIPVRAAIEILKARRRALGVSVSISLLI